MPKIIVTNPPSSGGGGDLPQPLATYDSPTFSKLQLTSNGQGLNLRIGDDAYIGDFDSSNSIVIRGVQNSDYGYISFGSNGLLLGSGPDGVLTWNGQPIGSSGSANTGDFVFSESTVSTNADMQINVNSVPGTIHLSAYNGVDLQFATSQPGAGLRFPDNTIQTTAYTGGADSHGNFSFDGNTLATSQGNSVFLNALDGTNNVKSQLNLDPNNGGVLLKATSWQNSSQFNIGSEFQTAIWASNDPYSSYIAMTGCDPWFIDFMNTRVSWSDQVFISVNGGNQTFYNGYSAGGSDINLYLAGPYAAPTEDPTVNYITIYYTESSKLDFNYDNGQAKIETVGMHLYLNSTRDVNLNAGDDVQMYANDTITFITNKNGMNNLPQFNWRMNPDGTLQLPGSGNIKNPYISENGIEYGSIELVPDNGIYSGTDQKIILDPTAPNHIHIRAGGIKDSSNAELILGGERTHVSVSDQSGNVQIKSKGPDNFFNVSNENLESSSTFIINTTNVPITDPYNWYVVVDNQRYPVDNVVQDFNTNQTYIWVYPVTFTTNQYYDFVYQLPENTWTFAGDGILYGPNDRVKISNSLDVATDLTVKSTNGSNGSIVLKNTNNDSIFFANADSHEVILDNYTALVFKNDQNYDNARISTGDNLAIVANYGFNVDVSGNNPIVLNAKNEGGNGDIYFSANDLHINTSGTTKVGGEGIDGAFRVQDANSNDLLKVLGEVVLGGAGQYLGSVMPENQIAKVTHYGSFYSTNDQFCTAGSIQPMALENVDFGNGVNIGGTGNTQITMSYTGKYNIAFSAQIQQNGGSADVMIWLSKNGVAVPNSNTIVHVPSNNPHLVPAWNWFVDAAANDYYEIMWRSDNANTTLQFIADLDLNIPGVPGIPSVIATVNQIG